jgi:hypothetical protein
MLIGVRKRGTIWGRNPQMLKLTLTTPQTIGNFSQRMRPTQLAKKHGNKLPPASETTGMTLSLRLFHKPLKFHAGK